ncbi:MAG: hypothetical protein M9957_07885 [Rhodobacteraceae bacterium]|nr:hypothetical protein [Paracoccaceae bacterium]
MKRAPRSRQRHDLYAKYHDYDSEISDLLGECGFSLTQPSVILRGRFWFGRKRFREYRIGANRTVFVDDGGILPVFQF